MNRRTPAEDFAGFIHIQYQQANDDVPVFRGRD